MSRNIFSVLQMCVMSNISKTNNGLESDSSKGVHPSEKRKKKGGPNRLPLRVCISLFKFVKVSGNIK